MPTLIVLSKLLKIPRVHRTKDFIAMIQSKDAKIVEVEAAEQILGEQNAILKREVEGRETQVAALEEKVAVLETSEEILGVVEADDTISVLKDTAEALNTPDAVRNIAERDAEEAGLGVPPEHWATPPLYGPLAKRTYERKDALGKLSYVVSYVGTKADAAFKYGISSVEAGGLGRGKTILREMVNWVENGGLAVLRKGYAGLENANLGRYYVRSLDRLMDEARVLLAA